MPNQAVIDYMNAVERGAESISAHDPQAAQLLRDAVTAWGDTPITPPAPTSQLPAASRMDAETSERLSRLAAEIRAARERATSSPEYLTDFLRYVRSGGRQVPDRLQKAHDQAERLFLITAIEADGGVTVPAQAHREIERVRAATSVIRRAGARPLPCVSDVLSIPLVEPNASSPDIYTSAFVGKWIPETPASTEGEAEPVFGRLNVPIRRTRALVRFSEDLAADTPYDLIDLLATDGGGKPRTSGRPRFPHRHRGERPSARHPSAG